MTKPSKLRQRRPDGDTPRCKDWGIDSEYGVLRDVLLAPPQHFRWLPTSSISKATLRRGHKLDFAAAIRQHREMTQVYEDAGVRVHFLEPDPNLPYQVFARDSSVMTPYGAIITQMAQSWRRGEYAPALRFYTEMGIPIYDMVSAGAFEGGDFNVIEPGCVLLGYCGERTQDSSVRQVGAWMEQEGWEVRYIDIAVHYVHIDFMVCMLAEKLAAVCVDTTDPGIVKWLKGKRIEIVPVSYQDTMTLGCNVMALGGDRVVSPAQSVDLNAKLRARGFEVYDPDVSMFTMGGGGIHCMAMPLRRDPV